MKGTRAPEACDVEGAAPWEKLGGTYVGTRGYSPPETWHPAAKCKLPRFSRVHAQNVPDEVVQGRRRLLRGGHHLRAVPPLSTLAFEFRFYTLVFTSALDFGL